MAQIQKIDRVCTPLVGTATRFASSLQRELCDTAAIDDRQRTALIIEIEMFRDRRMLGNDGAWTGQFHMSRRRAPMSTGAVGCNGIASAAQFGAAVQRVKSPRTSSGRKRDRGAIT